MEPGKKVYDLRKANNMTQGQLASEMGVSITAVSKWENNCSLPDVLILCTLANYFNVTTDFLLGRDFKRYKAIVVEPAGVPCEAITKILENNRCSVVAQVKDFERLNEKLMKQKVDFITIEADVDKSDNLDELRKVHLQYPDLKIFVFSNNCDKKRIEKAYEVGVSQYYTKPFHENSVLECVSYMNESE